MKPLARYEDFENFLSSRTNYERQRTFRYGPETLRMDRMRSLVRDIGNPHLRYPTVHVAGTKGKGATSLILEALLIAEGLRVGTYTSPHIEEIRERVRVGGEAVSRADLVRVMNLLLPALTRREEQGKSLPTFFEIMTALAMIHFANEHVDWAIFEVGIGGRLDATNIIEPRWCAITSVGLEHTHILGRTLRKIAVEKAGIIKPETPVVIGHLPREALRVVQAVAHERSAELIPVRPDSVRRVANARLALNEFSDPFPCTAIRGPALRSDLSIALRLHRAILSSMGRPVNRETLAAALRRLRLPARVEVFDGDPPVVLDGAHTVDSFRALRLTLEEIEFPRPRTLVLSIASDKWLEPIIHQAHRLATDFILTRADGTRSLSPQALRDHLGQGTIIDRPLEALGVALERARPVVIGGSVYLAGTLRGALAKRGPRSR